MSLLYLLDTNIISESLTISPSKAVLNNIKRHQGDIAVPAFVVYELIKGAYQLPESAKKKRILHYIDTVVFQLPILLYTKEAAVWHGKEIAYLQSLGKTAPFLDSLIAATAKAHNLILVTRNNRDFKNIKNLSLENWFD